MVGFSVRLHAQVSVRVSTSVLQRFEAQHKFVQIFDALAESRWKSNFFNTQLSFAAVLRIKRRVE